MTECLTEPTGARTGTADGPATHGARMWRFGPIAARGDVR